MAVVTKERDAALQQTQELQNRLESLGQALKVGQPQTIASSLRSCWWGTLTIALWECVSVLASMWLLVSQHMRDVAERRQQLELEHEKALLTLRKKQNEARQLQQVRRLARRLLLSLFA